MEGDTLQGTRQNLTNVWQVSCVKPFQQNIQPKTHRDYIPPLLLKNKSETLLTSHWNPAQRVLCFAPWTCYHSPGATRFIAQSYRLG
jgi:hypothetical protein